MSATPPLSVLVRWAVIYLAPYLLWSVFLGWISPSWIVIILLTFAALPTWWRYWAWADRVFDPSSVGR